MTLEWYWVAILCWIAATVGLLVGCMCRVSSDADKRAGQMTGGMIDELAGLGYWETMPQGYQRKEPLTFIVVIGYKKFRWKNYYRAKKLSRNGNQVSMGR